MSETSGYNRRGVMLPLECLRKALEAEETVGTDAAMEMLGILTRKTMYTWLQADKLPGAFKIGDWGPAAWVIPRHAILTYWRERMGADQYQLRLAQLEREGCSLEAELERASLAQLQLRIDAGGVLVGAADGEVVPAGAGGA